MILKHYSTRWLLVSTFNDIEPCTKEPVIWSSISRKLRKLGWKRQRLLSNWNGVWFVCVFVVSFLQLAIRFRCSCSMPPHLIHSHSAVFSTNQGGEWKYSLFTFVKKHRLEQGTTYHSYLDSQLKLRVECCSNSGWKQLFKNLLGSHSVSGPGKRCSRNSTE